MKFGDILNQKQLCEVRAMKVLCREQNHNKRCETITIKTIYELYLITESHTFKNTLVLF